MSKQSNVNGLAKNTTIFLPVGQHNQQVSTVSCTKFIDTLSGRLTARRRSNTMTRARDERNCSRRHRRRTAFDAGRSGSGTDWNWHNDQQNC